MIPPLVLAFCIFCLPESPRWHLTKAHETQNKWKKSEYYRRALHGLTRLRGSELLAGRAMMLMHDRLLKEDKQQQNTDTVWHQWGVYEIFATRRYRRAFIARLLVMCFQKFCAINVFIYCSSSILHKAEYNASKTLLVSSPRYL